MSKYITVSFSAGSVGKESACNAGDTGLIPWSGRSPGGGNDNPPQYSCQGKSHGQMNLEGYSLCGCKEPDLTESLNAQRHTYSCNQTA